MVIQISVTTYYSHGLSPRNKSPCSPTEGQPPSLRATAPEEKKKASQVLFFISYRKNKVEGLEHVTSEGQYCNFLSQRGLWNQYEIVRSFYCDSVSEASRLELRQLKGYPNVKWFCLGVTGYRKTDVTD